jgi:hypothetical protein
VLIAGTGRREQQRFTLRLSPRERGTEGRLLLSDHD